MMSRDELIDNVAELYIQGSDSNGSWDSRILEMVMGLIAREGSDRIARCTVCSTHYPTHLYDDCPYYDDHQCAGGCGETNNDCTCDCCGECGYYDCECPHCTKCANKRSECECPPELAVFT